MREREREREREKERKRELLENRKTKYLDLNPPLFSKKLVSSNLFFKRVGVP